MSRRRKARSVPFAALTHVGMVRALNEDSLLALPPLYAVADGLGGHQSGEVASQLAISALRDNAPRHPDATALARAVQAANQAVIKGIEKGKGRPGMGTTMTAAMIAGGSATVAQVGDSRAYLLRNRSLSQITEDHSVVGAMMRSGHLSAAEARSHPQRSVITRALGSDPALNVDTFEISVLRGDRLLICTDGLTSMVDDAQIEQILVSSLDPNHAAEKLVQAALDAGGSDNVSVIIVDVTEEHAANAALSTTKQKKPRSKLWLWALLWATLVAAALAGVFFVTLNYVENRAYLSVGTSGHVYINQGMPGSILDFTLTFASYPTKVEFDLLAPEYQATLRLNPGYQSREDALADLEVMVSRSPLYRDNLPTLFDEADMPDWGRGFRRQNIQPENQLGTIPESNTPADESAESDTP
ncbi:MAG: Stp1/IreP family PP2C-type Ser/Thr phosphatase [Coriobacteriia bacterium]|nr:Stp1/IreP family PP2C-type Ser/Thr phosphatase [Coriobacteriia bacterium]